MTRPGKASLLWVQFKSVAGPRRGKLMTWKVAPLWPWVGCLTPGLYLVSRCAWKEASAKKPITKHQGEVSLPTSPCSFPLGVSMCILKLEASQSECHLRHKDTRLHTHQDAEDGKQTADDWQVRTVTVWDPNTNYSSTEICQ